ncbi:heparan-alpha-glucosaminide N-acetyltransferase domain-containing protein [Blastococcus sp. HT6-30]|uniref:heparan-alpha-glucosaminide N-acetyltransferase domain-containing protein n=1 Tax=Blastococcus sp. HT6-30 TaxID=3144843 RepID=UPI003219F0C8
MDATRGLALLGMMAVHSLWAYDDDGDVTWHYALAAGQSAATFALLAGIGIAFMTGRRRVGPGDRKAAAASLAARAGVIAAVGLALGWTDPGVATVILVYYAVLFVLAIPAVLLSTRALLAVGVTIAVVVPVLSHLARPALPAASADNVALGQVFTDPFGLLLKLTVTGLYPALPWMAYICIGIAIGRLRLSEHRVAVRLLAVGAAAGAGAWALSSVLLGALGGESRLYATAAASGLSGAEVGDLLVFGSGGVTPTGTWWWLATIAPHTSTPLDLIHTIGVATAVLGGMLLLARRAGTVLLPIAAAGGMTLTLYTAHVLFINSPLDSFSATPGYLVQVAVALAFAVAWRQAVGRGPLEQINGGGGRRPRAARRARA